MSDKNNDLMSDEQFAVTHAKLASQGGFTVNPRTGADVTSGISVAPRENEHRDPISESTASTLKTYATRNTSRWTNVTDDAGKVTATHNASLGGWRSDSQDVLDTPTVYRNTPGGQSAARKNMVLSEQEAGFDLDSFQEIHNPFHPKGREAMGMEGHELANLGTGSRARSEWQLQQPEVQAWVRGPADRGAHERRQASRSAALPKQGRKR